MKKIIVVFGLFILLISIGCVSETTSNIPETTETSPPTHFPKETPIATTAPTTSSQTTSSSLEILGVEYQEISVQEAMKKIENNGDITILDVRTAGEYDEGYIGGAVHIPYQELEKRHLELNIPKDKEIIVYCKAGVRSKKGAQQLTELGYTNVVEMGEGIDGWVESGGNLVKKIATPTPTTTPPLTESPPPTHFPEELPTPSTTTPSTTPLPTISPQLQTTTNPFNLNTSNNTKSTYKQPKENC